MSLPAADELFRNTGGAAVQPSTPHEHGGGGTAAEAAPRVPAPAGEPRQGAADGAEGAESGGQAAEEGRRRRMAAEAPARGATERQVPGQPKRDATGPGASAGAKGARAGAAPAPRKGGRPARRPSGRERHDEKITVYVSAEELMDLEHARLVLRGEHGLAVDRGRIVREAVAVVLADLESRGEASILVRRLRGR
ncbi:hypothetical protein D7294_08280 [Streptomyces hoynatensis]|uniref:Cobyrinic acid a,c-diamide synthase n=1 Tax=Streptomyces hoynatensis TaxID=1141874 RepID=A0A3A9Z5D9_9ACTN|nr:hypothetical protein D7294_08280 [Streptomyces hoynatensis]